MPDLARVTYTTLSILDPKVILAHSAETPGIYDSLAQMRTAHIASADTIPLIAISRGQVINASVGTAPDFEKQRWRNLQTGLAALSPLGKQVLAEENGHFIQMVDWIAQPSGGVTAL